MAQTREIDYIVNAKINKAGFNALKSEIQSLRSLSEKDLINIGSAKSFTEAQTQLKAIQASATQVEAALNKAFSVKLGTVSLSKFNNELRGLNLKAIAADFSKAGAAGTAAFNNLAASVLTTKTQIKETNKWLDEMGKTMSNTIKWGLSSSAWNTMTGSFQKAYNYAKDLDKSLNNIRIVSEKSADDMARFAVQANRAAKALGSTTLDYTDASLIYYQQGLAEKEVAARTETTVKLSNVLGISAQEVSDYMTAIWNNFDDGSKSIEYYADVITKLGAATASSAEEISTGLEKFAAIADTVGLSYEYATAALTTVTATTRQSAEVVGTAFKTLFARIQDLELGDTLEDGTTLGKYSEALNKIGINIKDTNGGLKDMDSILNEMGNKWDTLSDAQKVSLAQTVAGTRQYTQLVALMDNWDDFSENLKLASTATGALNKQQDIYLESTQAHLDKLSASTERLYSNLIDSEGLNDLVDIFSGLVTGVSEYTEAIGGSKAALTQIGAILTKTFSRTISQTIATTVSNFRKMAESADDFKARAALLNQFKGIEINSNGYQNLLKMVEALHEYQDVLSEEQVQAANATIMEYNEAENRRDAWLEAKTFAEQYYQTITGGNVADLNTNFGQNQLQEYFKEMDVTLDRFQSKLGEAKKNIQKMLSGEVWDQQPLDAYVDALRENLDIIDDADLKVKAQSALEKYDKEKFGWATDTQLTDEGVESLKGFDEVFGEVADNITKNSKKVKTTFKDAMMGMEEATKTGVDECVKTWNSGIKEFDVQTLAQNAMNLSSQLMMISSSISSIKSIPNIWNNEDLSTGEKILQTAIAVGNVLGGVGQSIQAIHSVAEVLNGTILKNTVTTGGYIQAKEKLIDKTVDNIQTEAILQDTIQDAKDDFDIAQEEYVESSKRTIQNTSLIDGNTKAIRQQSAALVEQNKIRQLESSNKKSLSGELIQNVADDVVSQGTIDAVDAAAELMDKILPEDELARETEKIFNNLKKKIEKEAKEIADSGIQSLFDNPIDEDALWKQAEQKAKLKLAKKQQSTSSDLPNAVQLSMSDNFDEIVGGLDDVGKSAAKTTTNVEKASQALAEMGGKTGGTVGSALFGGLKADLATIGSAIAKIPPQAYIAVAAIAALGVAIWALHEAATKEQDLINNLKEGAQELTSEYENLASETASIKSEFDKYNSIIETLNGCTKGTKEWEESLKNANAQVLSILDKYPDLAELENLFTRVNGVLTLNSEVLDKYIQKREKVETIIQSAGLMGRALAGEKQEQLNAEGLSSKIYGNIYATKQTEHNALMDNATTNSHFDRNQYFATQPTSSRPLVASELEDVREKAKLFEDNLEDLAGLTQEEYKQKLTELGFNEEYIESLTSLQDAVDKQVDATDLAAEKINAAAKYIAGIIVGDGGDSKSTVETQTLLSQKDYTDKYNEQYDKWEEKLTDDGISKVSGQNNAIVKEMLKELQKVPGFEDYNMANNAVRGTDNERKFAFLVNGEEKIYSAEQVATLIATNKATAETEKHDYGAEATKILEPLTEALGGDQRTADALIGAISSKDYNSLTQEQLEKIKTANSEGLLTDIISKDDWEALGMDAGTSLSDGITTALENWDESEAKEAQANKLKMMYEGVAEELGVSEKAVEAYTKKLVEESDALTEVNDIAVAAAKAHFQLAQQLDTLSENTKDNEKMLRNWAKGMEVSMDDMDTVGKVIESVSDIMGTDVSDNFVKKNLEDILKLAKGDISVLDDLQKAFAEDYILENVDISAITDGTLKDNITAEMQSLIDDINGLDLDKIEIGTTLDDAGLTEGLQALLDNAVITKDQANAILQGIGYEPEITYKTFKVEGEQQSNGTYKYLDENGTAHYVSADFYDATENTVTVPILNGKQTEFKGANKTNFKHTPKASKSKGGGGSSSKPKQEEKIEDKADRYHDVDVALKHISNSYEKINKEAEKLTGKSRLDNLTKQFRLLNKEIESCNDKIEIAKGEMGELQTKLSGSGVKFNADGTIANYEDAYTAQLNYVNSVIDHYNSLSASGQEKYQKTLDKAKENFEKFKEDISRYDELTTDVIPGIETQVQDAIDKQIELKIEAFNMEIKIRLEMSQAERDWNDFYKKVVKGIQDDDIIGNFDYAIKNFSTYLDKDGNGEVVSAAAQVKKIQDEIEKMEKTGSSDVYGKDKARAMQELKDAIDQSMASLTEMQELIDEIKEAYLSMMDEAKEKFNEQVSLYEQVAGLIDHDMNIISLVYGEEAYDKMAEYYKKQKENNESQLDFLSKEVSFWEKQMTSYKEGSKEWESAKEKWLEASEAWAAQTEKDIQTIRDEFLNAINVIFQELNSKMTGGMGLGYIEEQWNLINKNTDQYLDSINAIYSVQQLQNKYLESINSYDSVSAQSKLNELMEQEISYLQEQDKLSQYDIDRAELKYQIALKQIALEEAQQNKSSMRLRRDSQGNYSYQYTADNDQMSKVRQEISDLYNQLYNLDSDQYKSNLDEYYSVWVEFQEKMAQAAQINDPEMRAQQELLIREQYGELINTLTEKNELVKDNLYNSTMSHLFELYDQNSANYEMMTEEQRSVLDNYFTTEAEMQNTAFNNLFGLYDQNLDAFENMTAIEEDILMNSIIPTWDSGIQHMIDTIVGEGGFEIACADAFAQLDELTKNYDAAMETRVQTYEERAEKVQEQTKELIKDNQDLIKEYETKLKYMEDEINYINSIVAAYDKATESAKNLTQAAYEYWAELKRQEAEDAKNQTVTDEKSSTGGTPKQEQPKDVVKNNNTNNNPLGYASNGAPFIDTYTVKSGDNLSRIAAKYGISWKRIYTENKSVIGSNANLIYPGQKFKIPKYLSGGYTGDWAGNGGQLAMLHKKELVLNARDTENMLNAIEILRNITNGLNATMLSRLAGASANGFGGLVGDGITQNVHISAEFPNATSSREIEDALNNLVNRASQEIHKK